MALEHDNELCLSRLEKVEKVEECLEKEIRKLEQAIRNMHDEVGVKKWVRNTIGWDLILQIQVWFNRRRIRVEEGQAQGADRFRK